MSHLTVTQTRELLESLKGVVRDFAVAEEKLNKDFRRIDLGAEILVQLLLGGGEVAHDAFERFEKFAGLGDGQVAAHVD